MTLRKSTFRYVEQELYAYNETKHALDELTEDILHATPPHHEIHTTDPGDPTGTTAHTLATNKLRQRMIDVVYAVEISFIEIAPEHRDVLEDKYWKRSYMNWEDAAAYYHMDRTTLYRRRRSLVDTLAVRLGLF